MADGAQFLNVNATPAQFSLLGGHYGVTVNATWAGGTVSLHVVSVDGHTLIPAMPVFAGNGFAAVDLPAGHYQLTIQTATAVYATVTPIK